jgi:hypothetical protein
LLLFREGVVGAPPPEAPLPDIRLMPMGLAGVSTSSAMVDVKISNSCRVDSVFIREDRGGSFFCGIINNRETGNRTRRQQTNLQIFSTGRMRDGGNTGRRKDERSRCI